jgi:hypothetical protein
MEDEVRPRLIPESSDEVRRRGFRGFGIGLGAILCWFAFRSWRNGSSPYPFAVSSVLSWTVAAFRPSAFGPVYTPWMKVVAVLARVNIWLVCGLLYYGVVTPYALVLRLFGVRPLELGLRERDSYWDVKPPRDPVESSHRSF